MSSEKQKQWLERRKAKAAMNRHQGRLQVPGSNPKIDINEKVFKNLSFTGLHSNSLDRQVTERVNIENFEGQILMNRRNEMGGVRLERMQYRRWGGNQ